MYHGDDWCQLPSSLPQPASRAAARRHRQQQQQQQQQQHSVSVQKAHALCRSVWDAAGRLGTMHSCSKERMAVHAITCPI